MAEKEYYDFVEVTSADILADRRGGWEGFTRYCGDGADGDFPGLTPVASRE